MAKGQILPRRRSRWLLRVYQGEHPVSRARIYKNVAVWGTRESAEQELARQLALRPQRPSEDSRFADFVEYWLAAAVEPCLRAKTTKDYRGNLARYALPSIGNLRLKDLSSLHVQELYSRLSERRLSARTIRYTHSIVHASLEQARLWDLIPANPAVGLPLPENAPKPFEVFTAEQARRFIAAASVDPDGLVLLVGLATGMRPSEYLALRRCDFNGDQNTFAVERTIERQGIAGTSVAERGESDNTTEIGCNRFVSVPGRIASLVAARIYEQMLLDTTRLGTRHKPGKGLIFRTKRGKPIHERNLVQRVFKPLLQRAGLPNLRLYDLRHTFAVLALRAGAPMEFVSEQLGHSCIAFTIATYGHEVRETQETSVGQSIDSIFGELPKTGGVHFDAERKPVRTESTELKRKLA